MKTSVDNPLLAPSGHGGRKTWFTTMRIEKKLVQQRFQGRKMKRGFKGRANASSTGRQARDTLLMITQTLGRLMDNGNMVNGKMHPGTIGPGTMPGGPTGPKAKERNVRRENEKASVARTIERPMERTDQPSLQILPKAAPQLPQRSLTVPVNLSPPRRMGHSSRLRWLWIWAAAGRWFQGWQRRT